MKPIDKLKPVGPTPADEMCQCQSAGPVMLRSALGAFPVYCMSCNGEIPLDSLTISSELAESIASWLSVHDSLFYLWLDSGEYETWAKKKLLDQRGEVNVRGLSIASELSIQRQTFFYYFQDNGEEGYAPPEQCPFCGAKLEPYENKEFQVCLSCQVVV